MRSRSCATALLWLGAVFRVAHADSTANAFLMAGDGSLWFGAIGGATHVFAQHYDGPPRPPNVAFLRVRLGDQVVPDRGATLEVPHDRNALALELGSSSMLDATRLAYEVRLAPHETAWSATRQREVRYASLLPGITVALCGEDALAQITGGTRFDAIVSDVMMPNMTGIELFEELQRVAPGQAERLIFLSGGAFTAQARAQLAQLGVLQLEKPVTAKELRATILRIASGPARP